MSRAPVTAFIELLERVVPGFEAQCRGASPVDIRALADYCDNGLPPFYEWFLSQLGVHAGPLATPRFDFSIAAVLAHLREDEEPDPRSLVIAVGRDPVMPQDIAYDLRHRTPIDSRVTLAHAPFFESLEAMLVWRLYERYVLPTFAQRCCGVFRFRATDFDAEIDRATTALGLAPALDTGAHAKALDGQDCAMTLLGNHHGLPTIAFHLATTSSHHARTLLGQLTADHGFDLELLRWDPVLV